jgi:hypothetical protein
VTEYELVEVNLELIFADAMIGSDQPLLEVADGAVREGHDRLGPLPQVARRRLNTGNVPIAGRLEARITLESVALSFQLPDLKA